jgi:hypothetical protein
MAKGTESGPARGPGSSELRGEDVTLRPVGYEPGELPNCSTPRRDSSSYRPVTEATGREIFMDDPSPPGPEAATEPTGQEWDEDDEEALRARYPRLNPLPY